MAVEELVTVAMPTRKALAAAMAAGRWSYSVSVQGVVVRAVFVGEGELNACAVAALAGGGCARRGRGSDCRA